MRIKYIIGLIIICGAFFYLVWTSFRASFQFALTPTELFARRAEYEGKIVKITGSVKSGSIVVEGTDHRFVITDGKTEMDVYYKGIAPNTFREGADIVVTGRFLQTSKEFEATQLLTKCASKYEAE